VAIAEYVPCVEIIKKTRYGTQACLEGRPMYAPDKRARYALDEPYGHSQLTKQRPFLKSISTSSCEHALEVLT
jgi:hypothetical protein